MAIKHRRGDYNKFDPTKMVAGEFGFVLSSDPKSEDGKSVYATFTGGVTKKLATEQEVAGLVAEAKQASINAKISEDNAKTSEESSIDSANLSKSYAVGGTGTRPNEDTDNAKYYKEYVESAFTVNIPEFRLDPSTMQMEYRGGVFGFKLEDGILKWAIS